MSGGGCVLWVSQNRCPVEQIPGPAEGPAGVVDGGEAGPGTELLGAGASGGRGHWGLGLQALGESPGAVANGGLVQQGLGLPVQEHFLRFGSSQRKSVRLISN